MLPQYAHPYFPPFLRNSNMDSTSRYARRNHDRPLGPLPIKGSSDAPFNGALPNLPLHDKSQESARVLATPPSLLSVPVTASGCFSSPPSLSRWHFFRTTGVQSLRCPYREPFYRLCYFSTILVPLLVSRRYSYFTPLVSKSSFSYFLVFSPSKRVLGPAERTSLIRKKIVDAETVQGPPH